MDVCIRLHKYAEGPYSTINMRTQRPSYEWFEKNVRKALVKLNANPNDWIIYDTVEYNNTVFIKIVYWSGYSEHHTSDYFFN